MDDELQESLELLKSTLPKDFAWPHREGLVQALQRESVAWLTNVRVDVTSHLADRMVRWIVIRLEVAIDQRTKDRIWKLFKGELLEHIGGDLPLCPSNFGKRAEDEKYGSLVASL